MKLGLIGPTRALSTALVLLGLAGVAQAAPVLAAGSQTAADPVAAPSGASGPTGTTGPVLQGPLVAALRSEGDRPIVAGRPARFDATRSRGGSGKIVSYRWFWDGRGSVAETTTVPRATHVFTRPGTALVDLEVVDDRGTRSSAELRIRVLPGSMTRAVAAAGPVARAAAGASVSIKDFSFGPAGVTIHAGDTVTWSNQGPSSHTATGSGFNTGVLGKGQSASHTFASAGSFSYVCSIHPFMKGTVTVLAAAAGSGSGAGASSGTGSAAPAPAATGPTLPRTGTDTVGQAGLGVGILMLGFALRRLTRRRR